MKRTLVRYRTTPETVEENTRLVETVFQELRAKAPAGARYLVLRLGDGTFIHLSESADGPSPIPSLDAFRTYVAGIKERCVEPPVSVEATVVGNYRVLGDS